MCLRQGDPFRSIPFNLFYIDSYIVYHVTVLGDSCAVTDACVSIPNAECRDDGSGDQCLCKSGYNGAIGEKACTVMGEFA